jgi:hypothetical protein
VLDTDVEHRALADYEEVFGVDSEGSRDGHETQ